MRIDRQNVNGGNLTNTENNQYNVRGSQYNAGGNINQYQGGQYNAGGNINQYRGPNYQARGNMYNNYRPYTENVERQYNVPGVRTIGYGIVLYSVLSFLLVAGVIGGVIWFISTTHLKIPDLGSNSSPSINQSLGTTPTAQSTGTPEDALKQFCSHMTFGDLQDAYDGYSPNLQNQISLAQFNQTWSNMVIKDCLSTVTTNDATSASGSITISKNDPSDHTGTFTTTTYNVTLVTNNGVWQIDSWQQVS